MKLDINDVDVGEWRKDHHRHDLKCRHVCSEYAKKTHAMFVRTRRSQWDKSDFLNVVVKNSVKRWHERHMQCLPTDLENSAKIKSIRETRRDLCRYVFLADQAPQSNAATSTMHLIDPSLKEIHMEGDVTTTSAEARNTWTSLPSHEEYFNIWSFSQKDKHLRRLRAQVIVCFRFDVGGEDVSRSEKTSSIDWETRYKRIWVRHPTYDQQCHIKLTAPFECRQRPVRWERRYITDWSGPSPDHCITSEKRHGDKIQTITETKVDFSNYETRVADTDPDGSVTDAYVVVSFCPCLFSTSLL